MLREVTRTLSRGTVTDESSMHLWLAAACAPMRTHNTHTTHTTHTTHDTTMSVERELTMLWWVLSRPHRIPRGWRAA
jgi:hypothetical protein